MAFPRTLLLLATVPLLSLAAPACLEKLTLAVGSYTGQSWLPTSRGAGVTIVDLTARGLSSRAVLGPAKAGNNPSYCAACQTGALFCANENAPGGLSRNTPLSSSISPSGGNGSTHVAIMPRWWARRDVERVVVANYGGSVTVLVPRDGKHVVASTFEVPKELASSTEGQQAEPHPHMILPLGTRFMVVPDLGSDSVWTINIDGKGMMKTIHRMKANKGDGPRHAARGPGWSVYVVNEISLTVMRLQWRVCSKKGYGMCQRVALLGKGEKTDGASAAAIRVTKDKRFLYASVRFPDTTEGKIVGFMLEKDGKIGRKIGEWTSHGVHPRDFFIVEKGPGCKSYVAIVNRDSDNLVFVERNTKSGKLSSKVAHELKVYTPTSVLQIPKF